jgi:hypothetical protein
MFPANSGQKTRFPESGPKWSAIVRESHLTPITPDGKAWPFRRMSQHSFSVYVYDTLIS